jgi:hypothetical protein
LSSNSRPVGFFVDQPAGKSIPPAGCIFANP